MDVSNAIVSILSRKASSTPSLPDATEANSHKSFVASTEQAASADNLAAKVWRSFKFVLNFFLLSRVCGPQRQILECFFKLGIIFHFLGYFIFI